jgi:hypothetical protein
VQVLIGADGGPATPKLHRCSMETALVRALIYASRYASIRVHITRSDSIRVHITRSDSTLSNHQWRPPRGSDLPVKVTDVFILKFWGARPLTGAPIQPRDASCPLSKRHVQPADRKRQLQERDVRGRGCNPDTVVPSSEIYLQP